MLKPCALIVEDDNAIRRAVVDALGFAGYITIDVGRGDDGLKKALSAQIDILLLDLILPGMDGLQILEEVRKERPTLPVIILTARGEEADRIKGLQLGADDYVVKPFSVKELIARVEAVLRRSPERSSVVRQITIPHGIVDLDRQEIQFEDGKIQSLSERECELMKYLSSHAGRTISRTEIITRIWNIDPRGLQTRTIDMHIARLREKLRNGSGETEIIRTIRGKGYLFENEGSNA